VRAGHADRLHYGATTQLARAKVEEWSVGDGLSFIHDLDVASNGKFYGTDEGHDKLWELDPRTSEVTGIDLPPSDLPRGGKFSGMNLPIDIFTGSHWPHSMAEASDGHIWIANALSSTIMSFDPATRAFKTYPVPNDALYPHTIRVDKNDIVWFTIVASNQIGRFDPKTEEMQVLRLPANGFWRWVSELGVGPVVAHHFASQLLEAEQCLDAELHPPPLPGLRRAGLPLRYRRQPGGRQHLVR
jgi:hypothetical protein